MALIAINKSVKAGWFKDADDMIVKEFAKIAEECREKGWKFINLSHAFTPGKGLSMVTIWDDGK